MFNNCHQDLIFILKISIDGIDQTIQIFDLKNDHGWDKIIIDMLKVSPSAICKPFLFIIKQVLPQNRTSKKFRKKL